MLRRTLWSLKYLFDSSQQKGVFPDLTKISIEPPVFKTGDIADISSYLPNSVLPCFSKLIERVRYNFLYKYLTDQKTLHPQQIGFRKGHFTEHAIALVDQIYESFQNDYNTIGIFGNLPKVFDTFDHTILLKKLRSMELRAQILPGFEVT